ncbi:methylmalonyl Co-A mutase-associated GTPase MeaB [Myxococcota bacterium]|nr:methylmalonyl Co-A mutase-associated GTPase MeaB [Myxococcota bacterium]
MTKDLPNHSNSNPENRPKTPTRRSFSIEDYIAGIRQADRAILGRAISLIESNRPDHREQAQSLLLALLPETGRAHRIGISGIPGVGKSTFIESFGSMLTKEHRVAVLAIDPSSSVSHGSILGDKTRMQHLASDPRAFIRPSPSSGSFGGVTRKTRETILLCEAAGFDIVIVETVGVGQSEAIVAEMVDSFLVLMLAGAGDELQGIKRGILEVADILAVNKADGDNKPLAERAQREYTNALRLMRPTSPSWKPPVLACSSIDGAGLSAIWEQLQQHRQTLESTGEMAQKRAQQQLRWMWRMVEDQLLYTLHHLPALRTVLPTLQAQVQTASITPTLAAEKILQIFLSTLATSPESLAGT